MTTLFLPDVSRSPLWPVVLLAAIACSAGAASQQSNSYVMQGVNVTLPQQFEVGPCADTFCNQLAPIGILRVYVPCTGTVTDVNVTVNVYHPFYDHFNFTLHHAGATCILQQTPAGCGDDSTLGNTATGTPGSYTWNDESNNALTLDARAAITGSGLMIPPDTYYGDQALSVFDGKPAAGVWEARFWDDSPTLAGTLYGVTLDIGTVAGPCPTVCTGVVPGVTAPSPRQLHAMAYDTAREALVLFGGYEADYPWCGTGLLGDTWEWNGFAWSLRSTTGPSPRRGHAMAYDRTRGKLVLFGGADGASSPNGPFTGDTWEWDGVSWTLKSSTGPPARWRGTMAWDGTRVVLFGGEGNGSIPLGDTWLWDGVQGVWSPHVGSGPSPRLDAATAYDEINARVLLHGGDEGTSTNASDTWQWTGSAWSVLPGVGPTLGPLCRQVMAYDTSRQRVVTFGGNNNGQLAATWELIGSTWTQAATTGPAARSMGAGAFHPPSARLVMFGGSHPHPYFGDTWEWDGASWTERCPNSPFHLLVSQRIGAGSLVIENEGGPPGQQFFSAFSTEVANANGGLGSGWWGGLHITVPEIFNQYSLQAPPFVGVLNPAGKSLFVFPPNSVNLPGLTAYGITRTFAPGTLYLSDTSTPFKITLQ